MEKLTMTSAGGMENHITITSRTDLRETFVPLTLVAMAMTRTMVAAGIS